MNDVQKRPHGPPPPPHVLSAFNISPEAIPTPFEGGQSTSYLIGNRILKRHPATDINLATFAATILAALPSSPAYRIPHPDRATPSSAPILDAWTCAPFVPHVSPLDPSTRPMTLQQYRRILHPARAFHAALAALPDPSSAGPWRMQAEAVAKGRTDRWAMAERVAFEEVHWQGLGLELQDERLLRRMFELLETAKCARAGDDGRDVQDCRTEQLVHGDLAGNVLFPDKDDGGHEGTANGEDHAGSLVIIDFSPCWRPVSFAEGMLAVDGALRFGAGEDVIVDAADGATAGVEMMLRALIFRAVSCSLGGTLGEDMVDFERVVEWIERRVRSLVGVLAV